MQEIEDIRGRLMELSDKERAEHSKKYLKSPYEFYGVTVPALRKVAKEYKDTDVYNTCNLFDELWNSGNHEEMSLALILLANKKHFNQEIWSFMIKRIEKAKTWDHIDELSSHLLGNILLENISLIPEIKQMAQSNNPWIRRTSMVSTIQLIRKGKIELTFRLAEALVYDKDIYVQKAAGWMLREAGKQERLAARDFILRHIDMKPTAFSYAIEKMPELREKRKEWEKK
jgi:Predicted DNA alkylation repair enzyme